MATKSFLKNIKINNSHAANKFVSALENAENKKAKSVYIDKLVEEVTDSDKIRKLFNR